MIILIFVSNYLLGLIVAALWYIPFPDTLSAFLIIMGISFGYMLASSPVSILAATVFQRAHHWSMRLLTPFIATALAVVAATIMIRTVVGVPCSGDGCMGEGMLFGYVLLPMVFIAIQVWVAIALASPGVSARARKPLLVFGVFAMSGLTLYSAALNVFQRHRIGQIGNVSCGGAGEITLCPPGYWCKVGDLHPEAGGRCVPEQGIPWR